MKKKHAPEYQEVKNVNWKEDEYRIMSSAKIIMLVLKNKIQMVRVQYPEESNQRPYRNIVGLISSSSKNKTLFLSLQLANFRIRHVSSISPNFAPNPFSRDEIERFQPQESSGASVFVFFKRRYFFLQRTNLIADFSWHFFGNLLKIVSHSWLWTVISNDTGAIEKRTMGNEGVKIREALKISEFFSQEEILNFTTVRN